MKRSTTALLSSIGLMVLGLIACALAFVAESPDSLGNDQPSTLLVSLGSLLVALGALVFSIAAVAIGVGWALADDRDAARREQRATDLLLLQDDDQARSTT